MFQISSNTKVAENLVNTVIFDDSGPGAGPGAGAGGTLPGAVTHQPFKKLYKNPLKILERISS